MRALGVDLGRKRIGLALSDATGLLARPFKTVEVTPSTVGDQLVHEIERLSAEEDGLAVVVVGMPRALDGTANEASRFSQITIAALRARLSIPVVEEDERLTSHEAEQRLAVREKDWRARKRRLDAAAAAILLQDYLDRQPRELSPPDDHTRDIG